MEIISGKQKAAKANNIFDIDDTLLKEFPQVFFTRGRT